jgi:putative oxygen-independent coproporphyrinogen III oxidase
MRRLVATALAAASAVQPTPTLRPPQPAVAAQAPGLYAHLPFCRRRCFYCDFPVVVAGDAINHDRVAHYVSLLERELSKQPPSSEPLATVYLGGGTPSLVEPRFIKQLLHAIDAKHGIARHAEITLECDPGTFDESKLRAYVDAGVSRVSLGCQSFDDEALAAAGRAHRRQDALDAVAAVKRVGPRHGWSLDLISGLPGTTPGGWMETLHEAYSLDPPHVSSYDLQVEEGTAFGKWYSRDDHGRPPLPQDEEAADAYRAASSFWRSRGYLHYEVSSYARTEGDRSRHNSGYWTPGATWRGLGLGAASSVNGARFSRPRSMNDYEAWVADGAVVPESSPPTGADALEDELLTSLRTSGGIDLKRICEVYGVKYEAAVRRGAREAVELGLAVVEGDVLKLTDPDGFLFSNYALAAVFGEVAEVD